MRLLISGSWVRAPRWALLLAFSLPEGLSFSSGESQFFVAWQRPSLIFDCLTHVPARRQSLWRNRLARSAVNRKVGGSSPPRDEDCFSLSCYHATSDTGPEVCARGLGCVTETQWLFCESLHQLKFAVAWGWNVRVLFQGAEALDPKRSCSNTPSFKTPSSTGNNFRL